MGSNLSHMAATLNVDFGLTAQAGTSLDRDRLVRRGSK